MKTTIAYVRDQVIPAAMALLPKEMDSQRARAMILAIGLQESRFEYRRQIRGPALSFWQAESGGGFKGIITHPATADIARDILRIMAYGEPDPGDFQAIEDNDILACVGARLLLWTSPKELPWGWQAPEAWALYLNVWRPGKPRIDTWVGNFQRAWGLVSE